METLPLFSPKVEYREVVMVLTSEEICKLFREVRKDDKIKTVVFRINSPGGSALASDEIWREVKLTNKKKKVIISMGDLSCLRWLLHCCSGN